MKKHWKSGMTKQDFIENILDFPVTTLSPAACIDRIVSNIRAGMPCRYFACANPHSLEIAGNDPVFHAALKQADLLVPDGIGMIIASRINGGCIKKRITGTDIFTGVNHELNKIGGSVFFLGSTEKNLEKIKKRMAHDFPHIRVAGTCSPPFKPEFSDEDNRRMTEAINWVKADVLWVGMTAPKQEKWIFQNRHRLDVKFIGPIGAVFDFYTGNVSRSHPVFQKAGLEWLPRLLRQPRRLYRRTFVSAPRFLYRVIRQRLSVV